MPVAIVALVLKNRREMLAPRQLEPVLARLEAMEARLATLERIATDPSQRLAREIDDLRAN